jgi:GT2 family glycosyltransferase
VISVVIPNLHSPLIDQVVEALERQTARDQIDEIIVVGQDRHRLVPHSATAITTPQPLAAAAARNLGARHARGAYLLFLDADCIAAPDLVDHLLDYYRRGCPVVGGSIAVRSDNYWVQCDHMLVFASYLPGVAAGERSYLPSGNLSVRREIFERIGGFDERFPGAAGEELDFCLRLRGAGHSLYFAPGAVVYHQHIRGTAKSIWIHLRRFGQITAKLWGMYPALFPAPLGGRLRQWSGLIIAAAPLLALRDVLRLYLVTPELRSYRRLIPGMVWAKMAWYWGVAEMAMIGDKV